MQDKAEANRGGLRVLKEVLRKSDGGKQAVAEGGERAKNIETLPAVLHEHEPSHHSHYVPFVRACGRPPTTLLCSRLYRTARYIRQQHCGPP